MTGLCGGDTTFSIFSLEAIGFLRAGELAMAALHVSISLAGWLLAAWAGWTLATRIDRPRRT
jgi:fluoride exporter